MRLRDAPKWIRWQVIYLRINLVAAIALIAASEIMMIIQGGLEFDGVVELIIASAVCLVVAGATLAFTFVLTAPIPRKDFAGFVAMNFVLITVNVCLGLYIVYVAAFGIIMLARDLAGNDLGPVDIVVGLCIFLIGTAQLMFAVQVSRRIARPAEGAVSTATDAGFQKFTNN